MPRGDGDLLARLVGRRHHIRIGQRQADRLADARHGVGSELAATGAVAGACDLFERSQLMKRAIASGELAHRLEDVDDGDVLVLEAAGQDRAAIDEDAGHVETEHRHHHARERFVAAGEADQRVIAMTADTELDRVGDDFAADERGLHPLMPHRDTVGDGDRVEAARHAAIGNNALARGVSLEIERGVARRAVVAGAGNCDEGLGDILFGNAHRIIIAAVWSTLRSDGNVAAGKARFVESVCHDAQAYVAEGPFRARVLRKEIASRAKVRLHCSTPAGSRSRSLRTSIAIEGMPFASA